MKELRATPHVLLICGVSHLDLVSTAPFLVQVGHFDNQIHYSCTTYRQSCTRRIFPRPQSRILRSPIGAHLFPLSQFPTQFAPHPIWCEDLALKEKARDLEPLAWCFMERVTGIEPALSAWKAEVLPLNHTRDLQR